MCRLCLRGPRSYPRNNDPVACTELGMLSKLSEEFEERNCNLLAIGVDSKIAHRSFIKEVQVKKFLASLEGGAFFFINSDFTSVMHFSFLLLYSHQK